MLLRSSVVTSVVRRPRRALQEPASGARLASRSALPRAVTLISSRRMFGGCRRFYQSMMDTEMKLIRNLEQYLKNDAEEEMGTLGDLLLKNGWRMDMNDQEISLTKVVRNNRVTIEIIPNTEESDAEKALLDQDAQESVDPEVSDGEEEADENELKGQHDFFKISISRVQPAGENRGSLIFDCSARAGSLMVEEVSILKPNQPLEEAQSAMFSELSENLQSSFEEYLQEHGINEDTAHIVSLCLYKYDLSLDQKWGNSIIEFLRS
ncbi:uncharacterized protein LOC126315350 [Schistocerca gregaria]|uniref:uncharacterized protein LOC126315350 n=1 Tax=Schistocerca gregaria TaxID=7010 RepID=UPI00211EC0DA|nr:uncharacterized protein LOC126315350 [Schistocerca gregaria]